MHTERRLRSALGDYQGRVLWAEHHESHAASAFYPSPFESAAILTIDGVGEWATATIGRGDGNDIRLSHQLQYPDSLGLLYSAFTHHAGFQVNSGEYKLMGLAPYGQPRYVARILDEVVSLRDDGSFTMDQRFFDYMGGLTMTTPLFEARFDGPARAPESPLTQREMDYARSVQDVCEEIVLRMARMAHRETGATALCMAGGVALNAVANGRVAREGPFEQVWIQPAAGDAGGAIGAAYLGWHRWLDQPRAADGRNDAMKGAMLGPSADAGQIECELTALGARFVRLDEEQLIDRTAELLAAGNVVGWFDGRMEFGPRALGARSILADPRDPDMQARLNARVKRREAFRPFAPSVLAERADRYFDVGAESPYMQRVVPVRQSERSRLPAVTHVDGSARVQTVTRKRAPRFHALLRRFEARTGCPMLVNTSFNVRDEPIVCTPADAYRCFHDAELDALVIYPFLLLRRENVVPPATPVLLPQEQRPARAGGRRLGVETGVLLIAAGGLTFARPPTLPTLPMLPGGSLMIAGAALIGVALLRGSLLDPLAATLTRLGTAVNRRLSPVVLTGIYLVLFAPIGFLRRRSRSSPFRSRPSGGTVWTTREAASRAERREQLTRQV